MFQFAVVIEIKAMLSRNIYKWVGIKELTNDII